MVDLELDLNPSPSLPRVAVIKGQPSGNEYRLPVGYRAPDLDPESHGQAPKALGEFYPAGKPIQSNK